MKEIKLFHNWEFFLTEQGWAQIMKKWIESQIIHSFFRFESQITNCWKILILNQSPWKWFESISNQIRNAQENDLWFEKDSNQINFESNWKYYSSIKNKFNISVIWKVFDSFTTNYQMNQIMNHKSFLDSNPNYESLKKDFKSWFNSLKIDSRPVLVGVKHDSGVYFIYTRVPVLLPGGHY